MEWHRIFLGEDFGWQFLLELVIRVFLMFVILLFFLRWTGKRSIHQLSILELIILITLSTAASDPMFLPEAAVLPGAIVIGGITFLFIGINFLTHRHPRAEKFIEGKSEVVVFAGRLNPDVLKREHLSQREFFARLRSHGYSHLGQINTAILEFTSSLTIYPYPDDKVIPGLPLLDDELFEKSTLLVVRSHHLVCAYCGASPNSRNMCSVCDGSHLVEAWQHSRVQ